MKCNYNAFYVKSIRNAISVDLNLDDATRRILLIAFNEAADAHKLTGCDCIQKVAEQTKVYPPEIRREIESRMPEIITAAGRKAA